MKLRAFLINLLSASLLASSPVVLSAPIIVQKVKLRQNSLQISGNTACEVAFCATVYAAVFDDYDGVKKGQVYSQIFYYSTNTYEYVNCIGPEFISAAVVDTKTFSATINATLSSANPHCEYTSQQTIVVNMTAAFDPQSFKEYTSVTTTHTDPTGTTKYKQDYVVWGVSMTGSGGYYNGAYFGSVNVTTAKIASGS
ncbi:hypothetical protein [Variovorax soli]|uniref:Uncharacterized protein n=1 Tax=Variovorax soli TaxID=376815 RepID=A0ABU1NM50_9BURK|nr:hypothetical protein [Variovorax soli]MDR6539481.1 hypothetical protein [Variovorax soli]